MTRSTARGYCIGRRRADTRIDGGFPGARRGSGGNALTAAAAIALALALSGFPARAQMFSYPVIIVPPAQNPTAPRPAPKSSKDKPKPPDPQSDAGTHYHGRTLSNDRF